MPTPPFIYDLPTGHIRSGWKQPIGKLLTDRRITRLQQEGHYGPLYKLPPPTKGKCLECSTTSFTKHLTYSYLPKSGVYCPVCLEKHREVDRKDRELRKRIRELRAAEFDVLNFL